MFKFTRNHLFSLGFVAVFAFNPGACARVGKGCGAASKVDDAARYTKIGTTDALLASRQIAESGVYRTNTKQIAISHGMEASKAEEISVATIFRTSTDHYEYGGKVYSGIHELPRKAMDGTSYVNESVRYDEAISLCLHGSRLIHHTETFCEKSERDYRLIVLLPQSASKVCEIYHCGLDTAQRLIDLISQEELSERIIRVNNYKELKRAGRKTISQNLEPILIIPVDTSFHPGFASTLLACSPKKNTNEYSITGEFFNIQRLLYSAVHAATADTWEYFFAAFSQSNVYEGWDVICVREANAEGICKVRKYLFQKG